MDKIAIDSFFLKGIPVRTTNQNGQSAKDIAELWSRFMTGNVSARITDKISDDIYCVYTDYETDHTGPYTAVLGYKVSSLDDTPDGLTGITIPTENYLKFTAKGQLPDCVAETWQQIWNTDLNRKYTADFDVWGEKSHDAQNAEVEILIAVD